VGESRGGMEGLGDGLRLLFRHNGTNCVLLWYNITYLAAYMMPYPVQYVR